MNAPQTAAICPTCGGSGVRTKTWVKWGSDREREKPQRCLACRGSGQVDPVRVCSTCGQWIDRCTCPKSKIIKLWKVDEMNGVNWVPKQQRWHVEFSKGGEHYYLGQYSDKALAVRCRMEAEQTPVEEYPALRAKYKALAQNGHVAPAPSDDVIEAEVPDLATADTLHEKLVAARAADQRFQVIREQYCAAERDAVDAWNEYARELTAYGQSDAFSRSYLGYLREEINRS